ncbi:MAG: efflux RND transporter permease subunit [Rhodobacteraceae bacterium]|nr:efflux RND transporter permease subunit [Paracoccaceae bacterium]
MTGLVDWATERSRMIIAFILLSLVVGGFAYTQLPKEGEPDIEIPALFVSVPFPGISAEDSEKLLVKPMETELSDLDGLKSMQATAAEGYAGMALEFEFGWDKTRIMADVRDAMNTAESKFPTGYEKYSINEINFSEFPIIIVNLSGNVPERTLVRIAKDLQDDIENIDAVLEAPLAGHRDEMIEVTIDPLRLEAYNITASELIDAVVNNNQLIAAGEVESPSGAFSVKIPASFTVTSDIFALPVKSNGDRVVTLNDLADIRLTFEDRQGTARFDGEPTVAMQVVKRKGFNLIDTAERVREVVEAEAASWPADVQYAVHVGTSNDQSFNVQSMVSQLESSVLTAIALVMIVVLASLGIRPSLLVGFAIPTSFLLCFAFLAVMGVSISNIVMFGLILSVGMLVDGAIVVVEYADRRIREGSGPMSAYREAAKRMFWPIISSTATTLCAFLPMLFWPGIPGQFMGMLPVTLIFVLSASLIVALIYLPVMGGVTGRMARSFDNTSAALREMALPVRLGLAAAALAVLFLAAMMTLTWSFSGRPAWPGAILFVLASFATSIAVGSLRGKPRARRIRAGYRRTPFGHFIAFITGNPLMPIVAIGLVAGLVVTTFMIYAQNNNGVEFFVENEPEQAIIYVRAKGNLSLDDKDAVVKQVEDAVLSTEGISSAFSFAGAGGLNSDMGGGGSPVDTIGQVQIETIPWRDRPRIPNDGGFWERLLLHEVVDPFYDGDAVLARLQKKLDVIPGIYTETLNLAGGPGEGKPIQLRLKGDDFDVLRESVEIVRAKFQDTDGLIDIEDTLPLPGIDFQIDVDVERAGRYGADVATVGAMVQLVTRGILLDTMRVDSSDEEIDIRVRFPAEDRVLATLSTLKVRTRDGLVPLSNFISLRPVPKLGQIDRIDQSRFFDLKADVTSGLRNDAGAPMTPTERITLLTEWLETEQPLPMGVDWQWTGDQEDQAESQAFLSSAFLGALGLMFIILLAQFNSFYNATLVLLAVVLSTTGVLIGMLVMNQPFSIIMTGTGIVALAGIVVNNNIVLIDTYQEYSRYMPRIEAITRTAEARIRPVLLTSLTTMAGLTPMMFGLSLDFIGGGASIDSPTALWWKQLATAVVFGLGIATMLTLIFTPSMLALRAWAATYVVALGQLFARVTAGRSSRAAQDWVLRRQARKVRAPEIIWDDAPASTKRPAPLQAAE